MSGPLKTTEERLADLENKVDQMMKSLNFKSPPPVPTKITPSFKSRDEIPPPIPQAAHPKSSQSTNLLPLLAVICFGLAGVFIVKLAIESGWLTPVRQWALLTLFGVALTGVALLLEKIEKDYRSYAGAAGVIVLYLAAYSSFLYFNLFPSIVAQGLAGLVSLFCFYLFHYYKTEFFIVICMIGTYISPVLLNKEFDLIYLSGFFLIWAALFSNVAIYLKSRTMTLLASYLGLGVFTFLNMRNNDSATLLNIILVQSMQFVIYAGGTFFYSLKNKAPLSKQEAMAHLPVLLFFYGTTYYFLNLYNAELAPYVSLLFAGFIYFLHWQARKAIQSLESQNLVQSFFAVVLFHSGYVQIVPASGKPWLLPLVILGIYISEQRDRYQNLSAPLRFMFGGIAIIEFFSLCFRLMSETTLLNVIPALASILVGFFYYSQSAKLVKDKEGMFLGLLHIICVLALYRLGYDYGSFAVSALWGLYSVIILLFGYLKKNAIVVKSSLVVIIVTTLKALMYDAGQESSGNRIGSLILTGAVLYGAGYLFQRANKWSVK